MMELTPGQGFFFALVCSIEGCGFFASYLHNAPSGQSCLARLSLATDMVVTSARNSGRVVLTLFYLLHLLCVLLGFISSLVWFRFSSWMLCLLVKLTQDMFGYHSYKSMVDSSQIGIKRRISYSSSGSSQMAKRAFGLVFSVSYPVRVL